MLRCVLVLNFRYRIWELHRMLLLLCCGVSAVLWWCHAITSGMYFNFILERDSTVGSLEVKVSAINEESSLHYCSLGLRDSKAHFWWRLNYYYYYFHTRVSSSCHFPGTKCVLLEAKDKLKWIQVIHFWLNNNHVSLTSLKSEIWFRTY